MKTKDNYDVYVGMWVSCVDNLVEITEIYNDKVYSREVIFDDDSSDKYHFGDEIIINSNELKTKYEYL